MTCQAPRSIGWPVAVCAALAVTCLSPVPAKAQTKIKPPKLVDRYCIYLTSWDYQHRNYAKIYYEYRWRLADDKHQGNWRADTLGYLGSAFTSTTLCATRKTPVVLEVQLDQSARPGYQIKRFRLIPKKFRVNQGLHPSMGCFDRRGQYHFARTGLAMRISSGPAPKLKRNKTCRWKEPRR